MLLTVSSGTRALSDPRGWQGQESQVFLEVIDGGKWLLCYPEGPQLLPLCFFSLSLFVQVVFSFLSGSCLRHPGHSLAFPATDTKGTQCPQWTAALTAHHYTHIRAPSRRALGIPVVFFKMVPLILTCVFVSRLYCVDYMFLSPRNQSTFNQAISM